MTFVPRRPTNRNATSIVFVMGTIIIIVFAIVIACRIVDVVLLSSFPSVSIQTEEILHISHVIMLPAGPFYIKDCKVLQARHSLRLLCGACVGLFVSTCLLLLDLC